MAEGKACRCDPEAVEEEGHVHDEACLCDHRAHDQVVVGVHARDVVEEDDAQCHCTACVHGVVGVANHVRVQAVVDDVRGLCRHAVEYRHVCRGVHRGEVVAVDHVHAPGVARVHALAVAHDVSDPLHHAVCLLRDPLSHLVAPPRALLPHREVEVRQALPSVAQR